MVGRRRRRRRRSFGRCHIGAATHDALSLRTFRGWGWGVGRKGGNGEMGDRERQNNLTGRWGDFFFL
jgi:hypothetical protein